MTEDNEKEDNEQEVLNPPKEEDGLAKGGGAAPVEHVRTLIDFSVFPPRFHIEGRFGVAASVVIGIVAGGILAWAGIRVYHEPSWVVEPVIEASLEMSPLVAPSVYMESRSTGKQIFPKPHGYELNPGEAVEIKLQGVADRLFAWDTRPDVFEKPRELNDNRSDVIFTPPDAHGVKGAVKYCEPDTTRDYVCDSWTELPIQVISGAREGQE